MNYRIAAGIVAIIAIIIGTLRLLKPSCHAGFKYPIKYLSTKSPYIKEPDLSYDFTPIRRTLLDAVPQECKAEVVWLVARHGTRNPGEKTIRQMLKDIGKLRDEVLAGHKNGGGEICDTELTLLRSWKPNGALVASKQKWLVPQGELELFGIGSRFREAFPEAFPKKYNPSTYKFKFTKTQRAEASARSFARGVFGEDEANKVVYPQALHADPILRFYKACPRWKRDVDKNPATYGERILFENSEPFREMKSRLQNRLGLTRALSVNEVELVHQVCAFETAWNPLKPSPWCNVFEEEDLKIMEYRQDLEYYWVDGYGHELTYKQACSPLADALNQFKSKIENPSSPHKVTAYFTHSGTLLKFVSHLGLFNDSTPLLSQNFGALKETRKWRTSFIDKFATNIAFVLFRCVDEDSGEEKYHVGTLFQEHPIDTSYCSGHWICPFEQFQSYFNETVANCQEEIASMCRLE